jgi:hypothetical protein
MALGGNGRRRRRSTLSHRAAVGVILLISAVGWGVVAGVIYVAIRGPGAITALFDTAAPESVEPAAGPRDPTTGR